MEAARTGTYTENRERAIKTASKKILSKDGWAMQSMIDYAISQKV